MVPDDQWGGTDRQGEEPVDFLDTECLGQGPAASGQIDAGERVAVDIFVDREKGEETVQGRNPAGIAAVGYVTAAAGRQKCVNIFQPDGLEAGNVSRGSEAEEHADITFIGSGSVLGKSFFGNEMAEINLQQGGESFWQVV
jgi:hypothetical protein